MLCSFGCGMLSIKQFKSGKYCCKNSTSQCPAMQQQNNQNLRKVFNWNLIQDKYDLLCANCHAEEHGGVG